MFVGFSARFLLDTSFTGSVSFCFWNAELWFSKRLNVELYTVFEN